MIRQLIISLAIFALSLGLTAGPTQQSTSSNDQAENSAADTLSQSLFRYKSGLLSGRAEKVQLEKVLAELGKTARLEFVLKYKPEAVEAVSFTIEEKVLADGLKEILRNYNYIFIPEAGAENVSKLILLGKVSADSQQPSPVQEELVVAVRSEKKPAEPWSLDDFQKLNLARIDQYGESGMTPEQREALEREELEQRMNRALDALDTDYGGLKEEAIGELTGMDNPEATNALLSSALNEENRDLKQIAAQALWHHAADLGFQNPEANQALQTLAEKGDSTTKGTAQKALEDARRYAKNAGESGGG